MQTLLKSKALPATHSTLGVETRFPTHQTKARPSRHKISVTFQLQDTLSKFCFVRGENDGALSASKSTTQPQKERIIFFSFRGSFKP